MVATPYTKIQWSEKERRTADDIAFLFAVLQRRAEELEGKGFLYIGTGVSGGEEGARYGPSLMPGGTDKAW